MGKVAVPTREREQGLGVPVAGADEVGMGPLCGPVVAACVVLPRRPEEGLPPELQWVRDSKRLSPKRREALFDAVTSLCAVGVGSASVAEIDELNVLQASFLAVRRAVAALPIRPAHVLMDGNRVPTGLPCPATAIVKADATCASVAAASIMAKVTRDRILAEMDREFPGYGWTRNSGYPTAEHREALARLGVTPHHRKTFRGVRELLAV